MERPPPSRGVSTTSKKRRRPLGYTAATASSAAASAASSSSTNARGLRAPMTAPRQRRPPERTAAAMGGSVRRVRKKRPLQDLTRQWASSTASSSSPPLPPSTALVVPPSGTLAVVAEGQDGERELRRELLELHRKVARMETSHKELELKLESQKAEAESRKLSDGKRIDQLSTKLKFVWEQDGKHKAEIKELRAAKEAGKKAWEEDRIALLRTSDELGTELRELKGSSGDAVSELRHRAEMAEASKEALEREKEALRTQLQASLDRTQAQRSETEVLRARASQADTSEAKARQLQAQLEILQQQQGLAGGESAALKSLQEEARAHLELQRTHRAALEQLQALRSREANASVLQERVRSLDAQVARNAGQQESLLAEQAQHAETRRQLQAWREAVASVFPEDPTEAGLVRAVAKLRAEHLDALGRLGEANAKAKLGERDSEQHKGAAAKADALVAELTARAEAAEKAKAKAERRLQFAVKERDGLKGILESINEDDTLQNHDAQRIRRIEELEASLAHRQDEVKELRGENSKLEHLADENKELIKLLEKAEEDCAVMQSKLGRGEFNPADTKVLHMTFNPQSEAMEAKKRAAESEEMQNLRVENEQLKAALASHGVATGGAPVTAAIDPAVLRELRGKLLQAESEVKQLQEKSKAAERLKSVFVAKTKEFREACFLLTGYKIEMKPSETANEYRLRSMYGTSANDVLKFRETETGLQLLDTDFCRRLDSEVLTVLERFKSIPAFTATITTELFQATTRAQ